MPLLMGGLAGWAPFVVSSLDNVSRWPAVVVGLGIGGGWVLLGLWLGRHWAAKRSPVLNQTILVEIGARGEP